MVRENSENETRLDNIVNILREATEGATIERFTNSFEFNNSCLLITILFLFLFEYKKEVMKFFK